MICPNCKKTLITVERNKVELDYCMFCSGFWFDADEWIALQDVLKIENIKDPFGAEAVRSEEEPKKCPRCGKVMEKVSIDGVLLDRCPVRHGMWFDKGEISAFFNLMAAHKTADDDAVSFLGEKFFVT